MVAVKATPAVDVPLPVRVTPEGAEALAAHEAPVPFRLAKCGLRVVEQMKNAGVA